MSNRLDSDFNESGEPYKPYKDIGVYKNPYDKRTPQDIEGRRFIKTTLLIYLLIGVPALNSKFKITDDPRLLGEDPYAITWKDHIRSFFNKKATGKGTLIVYGDNYTYYRNGKEKCMPQKYIGEIVNGLPDGEGTLYEQYEYNGLGKFYSDDWNNGCYESDTSDFSLCVSTEQCEI